MGLRVAQARSRSRWGRKRPQTPAPQTPDSTMGLRVAQARPTPQTPDDAGMKEHNRLRLERLTARYARRIAEGRTPDEADFLRSFAALRDDLLRPQMEEIAAELRRAGHDARILLDQGPDTPSIGLALGLRGATGSS